MKLKGYKNKSPTLFGLGFEYSIVEVRGIEPRSEMVYRSSIYMLSCRLRFAWSIARQQATSD